MTHVPLDYLDFIMFIILLRYIEDSEIQIAYFIHTQQLYIYITL